MTTTKTLIKPTWNQTKTQEETARVLAANFSAAYQVLSKYGEEAIKEYQDASRKVRTEHLKKQGVKSAIDLAKAIAEPEANLFGSQIEISGDENNATLNYNSCAMWNAMKQMNKMTPEQEEKMGAGFQHCMQSLAGEFGLKADIAFDGDTCKINFKK